MHRSGTNEEITEKGQLLQELSDIYTNKDSASQRRAEATQEQRQLAAQAREDACLTLGQRIEPVEPPAKRIEANQHGQSTGVPANQAC